MTEEIQKLKNMPSRIREIQTELEEYYESLVGLNIHSTIHYDHFDYPLETTWTYIYKHNEDGFKVNHAGAHYYMSEENMWKILENAIEIERK